MRIYFSYNPGSSFENPMLDIKVESKNEMSHEEVLLSNNSKHQNKYSKKNFKKKNLKLIKSIKIQQTDMETSSNARDENRLITLHQNALIKVILMAQI